MSASVARRGVVVAALAVLHSPEIAALAPSLKRRAWTGRPGYPIRSMVGMPLAKGLYGVPTWTRTVALVREHTALRTGRRGVPRGNGRRAVRLRVLPLR